MKTVDRKIDLNNCDVFCVEPGKNVDLGTIRTTGAIYVSAHEILADTLEAGDGIYLNSATTIEADTLICYDNIYLKAVTVPSVLSLCVTPESECEIDFIDSSPTQRKSTSKHEESRKEELLRILGIKKRQKLFDHDFDDFIDDDVIDHYEDI